MSQFKSKRPYETSTASSEAKRLREKLGPSFYSDKFTKFTWRGQKSWDIYYCFIINNGSDLKWVNSGAITNSYSKSLYERNQTLLGVAVGTKSMSLKLGLFAITTEEYRKFVYWMDPMAVDMLEFDTDNQYYYYAKLSSVGEATKYVIGKNEQGNELYYVELTVKFDLQGDGYAYSKDPIIIYNFDKDIATNASEFNQDTISFSSLIKDQISDIRTGLFIDITFFNDDSNIAWNNKRLELTISDGPINNSNIISEQLPLFQFQFNSDISLGGFGLHYDSLTGTIISQDKLLSLLTRGDNGEKVFYNFDSNKFLLPSLFEDGINIQDYKNIQINIFTDEQENNIFPYISNVKIYYYKKTLVI